MDIKKIHKSLIDKQGRRKYFKALNPELTKDCIEIDKEKITKPQKILFIVPNFNWIDEDVNALWDLFPWNLCQLAAMVKPFCKDVKIIDAYKKNLSIREVEQSIKDFKPDVTGITVLMDQYAKAGHMAAKIVKDFSKDIKTVIGGVYAMSNPKRVMEDKNFDYLVMGEGEYVFKQLIGNFSGACDLPTRGIAFRDKNGKVENRGHAAFIKNLDTLPRPAYELIDYLSYANNFSDRRSVDQPGAYPYARIITSRGCPEKCSFCQVPSLQGSFFRSRSPDNICNEIEWLKEKYGIKSVIFDDDNMFTNTKRAKDLLRTMIRRGLSMPWTSLATAVFRLDEEMIDLMYESGNTYIDVAIESGTERVMRDVILKPLDFKHAVKMVKYARDKGIFVAANYILGFPTETWEEILETIAFSEKINADYSKFFIAIPLKNTEMYDLALQTNTLLVDPVQAENMWTVGGTISSKYWSEDDLTILRAYEWDRVNFTDPKKTKKIAGKMGISVDELNKIRKKTLKNALDAIIKRNTSDKIDSSVTRAADIAKVSSQVKKNGKKTSNLKNQTITNKKKEEINFC